MALCNPSCVLPGSGGEGLRDDAPRDLRAQDAARHARGTLVLPPLPPVIQRPAGCLQARLAGTLASCEAQVVAAEEAGSLWVCVRELGCDHLVHLPRPVGFAVLPQGPRNTTGPPTRDGTM